MASLPPDLNKNAVCTETNIDDRDVSFARLLNEGGLAEDGEVAVWVRQQAGVQPSDLACLSLRQAAAHMCC
jgi:hypothetical protein